MSSMSILSMNINGLSHKGYRGKREQGIVDIVKKYSPLLMFIQECPWRDLLSTILKEFSNLEFDMKPEREGSNFLCNGLVSDRRKVTCTEIPDTSVNEMYENLQGNGNWFEKFELCRLALFKVKLLTNEILCASWHGPYNSEKVDMKMSHLKSMLAFLLQLKVRENCPLIIGGDFNMKAEIVKKHLNGNFKVRTPSDSSRDMILFTPDVEDKFNFKNFKALDKADEFDHAPLKIEVTIKTIEENDGDRPEAEGGQEKERDVQNLHKGREDEEKKGTERRKKEEEGRKEEDDRPEAEGGQEKEREEEKKGTERRKKEEEGRKEEDDDLCLGMNKMEISSKK